MRQRVTVGAFMDKIKSLGRKQHVVYLGDWPTFYESVEDKR